MIEEEVTFASVGTRLAGTLAMPDSAGPFPAVLLLPGSGQVDRNESHRRMPINALREIGHHLAARGFASFRYDKRGVGASGGDYWSTGFFDNATDALAALEFLKSQAAAEEDQVFLLGHSEGAHIATRLAGEGADVAGVVLLAGAARRGEETLKWQARKVAASLTGIPRLLVRMFRINIVRSQQKQLDKIKRSGRDWYRVQIVGRLNAKWMREFMGYDPAPDLARIRVPVLAITGSKDIQVAPVDLKKMAMLVRGPIEYHELPDGTHLLRVEEGAPTLSSYKKQVREPVDARVLKLVSDWLESRVATPVG